MAAGKDSRTKLEAVTAASASSKRKDAPREDEVDEDEDDDGSDAGSDVSMINVDFDFFNLNPDVDQIALKRLLRQTLSHDADIIDVHPLAELILSEGVRLGAGTSIKTDGQESDPWGLVAVIDIVKHRDNPAFRPFLDYLHSTLPSINPIRMLLAPSGSPAVASRPAIVFSLRLLNLPLPLIPPMYKMLLSELDASPAGKAFSHWLIWGRGYRLEGTEEGMGLDLNTTASSGKKKRKAKAAGTQAVPVPLTAGTFPYQPEEEYIDRVATHIHTYPFKTAPQRDEDAFGVEQFGRLVLVEKDSLAKAVKAMEDACR